MTTERVENMAGGTGHVLIKRLLDEKQLNGKCKKCRRRYLYTGRQRPRTDKQRR